MTSHHAVAPFRGGDLAADPLADLPVQLDQGGVDRLHRALPGADDQLRDGGEVVRW